MKTAPKPKRKPDPLRRPIKAIVAYPASPNPRDIRRRLDMSQPAFCRVFGLDLASLRGWERGARQLSGAARTLLILIDRAPDFVRKVLNRKDRP